MTWQRLVVTDTGSLDRCMPFTLRPCLLEPTTGSSSASTSSISTNAHVRAATAPTAATAATAASVDSKLQFSNGVHNKQQPEAKQQQRS
jgi:hypothetical protein